VNGRDLALRLLVELAKYHRIQGSSGLEDAAEFIKDQLDELGIPNEIINYYYNREYDKFKAPIGWDLEYGELEWNGKRITTNDSPLLVTAYSPPGEARGVAVYVGDGEDPMVNVDGKIVIARGNPFTVYRNAVKSGAVGLLLYREDAPSEAFPYMGLFLKENENGIPVMSIPREIVGKLTGNIVSMTVQSRYRLNAKMPVIVAGDDDASIGVISHYCHPYETYNDNLSGTVANILVARQAKALHVFVPEYWGSYAFMLEKGSKLRQEAFVNLDMVGENQSITGSTLIQINPPNFMGTPLEALIYRSLRSIFTVNTFNNSNKVWGIRMDISNYEAGSDHDVLLSFKIPTVMLNQWPDKFYHSSLDTLDKVSLEMLTGIASAVAKSINEYKEPNSDLISNYIELKNARRRIDGTAQQPHNPPGESLRKLFKGPIIDHQLLSNTWVMDILDESFNKSLFLSLIPITMEYASDTGSLITMIMNEYPNANKELIMRYLTTLEELGMIKLGN